MSNTSNRCTQGFTRKSVWPRSGANEGVRCNRFRGVRRSRPALLAVVCSGRHLPSIRRREPRPRGSPPPPTTGDITGVVSDGQSGTPINGALVSLDTGATTFTAPDGSYSFTNMPAGPHGISASANNYNARNSNVVVPAGGSVVENFGLIRVQNAMSVVLSWRAAPRTSTFIFPAPTARAAGSTSRGTTRSPLTLSSRMSMTSTATGPRPTRCRIQPLARRQLRAWRLPHLGPQLFAHLVPRWPRDRGPELPRLGRKGRHQRFVLGRPPSTSCQRRSGTPTTTSGWSPTSRLMQPATSPWAPCTRTSSLGTRTPFCRNALAC